MTKEDPLQVALSLRMPLWSRQDQVSSREKVAQLEEYLLLTAFWEGELAQERDRAEGDLAKLDEKWHALTGTSYHLGRQDKVSEAQIDRERREEDEDLWRERRDLQRRVKRIGQEIERMERDTKRASRVYTFITGG